jgi:hypothetical protein
LYWRKHVGDVDKGSQTFNKDNHISSFLSADILLCHGREKKTRHDRETTMPASYRKTSQTSVVRRFLRLKSPWARTETHACIFSFSAK